MGKRGAQGHPPGGRAGGDARLISGHLSPQDPAELCGQLGLCSSASALPLHTLLAEKATQVLGMLRVSGDAPHSTVLPKSPNTGKEELHLASPPAPSISISRPGWTGL